MLSPHPSPQVKDELYLNLVLDFIPETVYRVARHYTKAKQSMPLLYVKVPRPSRACPSYMLRYPGQAEHAPPIC